MRGGLEYDRTATILVEAAYYGDHETAHRWGISERTIQRYRQRLQNDDKLAEFVARKKAAFERGWADELPGSIKAGIDFLKRAAHSADPRDPDAIHAVAGALKIQTEVVVTKDILDARLARERGQANTTDGPLAAADREQPGVHPAVAPDSK